MTIPTLRRPLSAWRFVIDALRALTEPHADVADCDRRVTALAADSAIGRVALVAVDTWRRLVAGSATWRASVDAVHTMRARPMADRVRAVAIVAAAGAATVLVLRPLTTERDPLTWALPAAVGSVAALTWALADAVARAIEQYRA